MTRKRSRITHTEDDMNEAETWRDPLRWEQWEDSYVRLADQRQNLAGHGELEACISSELLRVLDSGGSLYKKETEPSLGSPTEKGSFFPFYPHTSLLNNR